MNSNPAQFSAGLPTRPKLHRDFSFLTIRVLQTQRHGDGNRNRTFAVICHTFQSPEGFWGFAVAGGEDESQHLAWHAVASWTWDAQDETCGICRMAFDGCCPDCKLPGDDCPLIWGACNHAFHLHCILKWVNSQTSQAHCPMCRREWQFKG
ncbi:unnamed protein product [Malus baccata var. baccata]